MDSDLLDELSSISFKEILDQDSRPTFVIDLDPDDLDTASSINGIVPIFCNAALRFHDRLLDAVTGEATGGISYGTDATKFDDFKAWATGITKFDDSKDVFPLSFLYTGMLWTGCTVRKRWRLISGNRFYQAPSVPLYDLSSGPPPEVATGGIGLTQLSDRSNAVLGLPSKSTHLTIPSVLDCISSISVDSPTNESKDTANTTPFSSSQQQALKPKGVRVSSASSVNTGNTTSTASITLSVPESGIPDWTTPNLKGPASDHILLARSIDWALTPLVSSLPLFLHRVGSLVFCS